MTSQGSIQISVFILAVTVTSIRTLSIPNSKPENIVSPDENVPFAEKIYELEKTVYAEEERSPLLQEREEHVLDKRTKYKLTPAAVQPTTGPNSTTIITGVGCGFQSMRDQQVIQIQSSNYGLADYSHGEACVWRFVGQDCGVSVNCPCFNVPASFKCFGDYLKFTDPGIYDQRFCGEVAPQGIYRSVTGHFRVRFRTDFSGTGQGFLCYISCTSAGRADPPLPANATSQCFVPPPIVQTTPTPTPSPVGIGCGTNTTAPSIPAGEGQVGLCPPVQNRQSNTDPSLVNTVGNFLNKFFNT